MRFTWFDKIATCLVDYASPDEVVFTKMDIKQRRSRDRTPWTSTCGQYEVRPYKDGWSWVRVKDQVRMSGETTWPHWEGARAACWQHTGVSVS